MCVRAYVHAYVIFYAYFIFYLIIQICDLYIRVTWNI